jgi:SNF2 family DNA or RNA helicase
VWLELAKEPEPLWEGFAYKPHQMVAIRWMLERESSAPSGGLLCDEMGLGKTMEILGLIKNSPKRHNLLLCPKAVVAQWRAAAGRSRFNVLEVRGQAWTMTTPYRSGQPMLFVTNYEKLYNNSSLFHSVQWDRVVLDEAHKIRNGDGEFARSCRKITAPIRWAVTGTPLVNSLKDVVSLMAFLGVPYSKLWRWEPRYLRILPELVLHRSLAALRGILKEAPPIPVIHDTIIPFTSQAEEEFYFGVQGANESLIRKYANELISPTEAFKLLLRLRQISVHPQVYINSKRREDVNYTREDWIMPSSKLEKIKEIIQTDNMNSAAEGAVADKVHKYIVFCQFNDEMSLIREFLLSEGLVADDNILLYNGSMNQAERQAVLKRSKATTETTVLLLQLQAGGVGLNLQEYDRIIFVSPWWTSALMDQAIARAVRMGQKEIVHVYHLRLAAEGVEAAVNIDELINAKAEQKRKMLEKLFTLCSQVE